MSDTLPEGEPDPLRDDPVVESPPTPAAEAPVEEVPAETPAAEEPPVEVPSAEEETYRKRYDDLRLLQTRTASERNDATRRAEEALRLAQQVYEQSQKQRPVTPTDDPEVARLRSEAAGLGITDEQLAFMEKLAEAKTQAQVSQFQDRYQTDQQQAAFQAQARDQSVRVMGVVEQFRTAHPDAREHEDEILEVIKELGALSPDGGFIKDDFSPADLEAAYEVFQSPELRSVLRANPSWYLTDDGMEYARGQVEASRQRASLAALIEKAGTTPTTEDREAAVAAAETLPASGGPPPTSGGSPQDEFDEVLAYAGGKRKSVFST